VRICYRQHEENTSTYSQHPTRESKLMSQPMFTHMPDQEKSSFSEERIPHLQSGRSGLQASLQKSFTWPHWMFRHLRMAYNAYLLTKRLIICFGASLVLRALLPSKINEEVSAGD
jgi:hypothetical protein